MWKISLSEIKCMAIITILTDITAVYTYALIFLKLPAIYIVYILLYNRATQVCHSPRLCVCVRYANGCITFFSVITHDVSIFSTDIGGMLPPVPSRITPASFSSLPKLHIGLKLRMRSSFSKKQKKSTYLWQKLGLITLDWGRNRLHI